MPKLGAALRWWALVIGAVAGGAALAALAASSRPAPPVGTAFAMQSMSGPAPIAGALREGMVEELAGYGIDGIYLIDGWVAVSDPDDDGETVRIDIVWSVRSIEGVLLGTVAQANRVPIAAVNVADPELWNPPVRAAAPGIVQLAGPN